MAGGSRNDNPPEVFRNPALTVDGVIIHADADCPDGPAVLLIRRGRPPFAGMMALPGGFVDYGEDIDQAIAREIAEETGLLGLEFRQFRTFGAPGRDPRGHTVSVVYTAVLQGERPRASAGDDAADAVWVRCAEAPPLAFDHSEILAAALAQLGLS